MRHMSLAGVYRLFYQLRIDPLPTEPLPEGPWPGVRLATLEELLWLVDKKADREAVSADQQRDKADQNDGKIVAKMRAPRR